MVFKVSKASEYCDYVGKVEINTLEELFDFMEKEDSDVIIYKPVKGLDKEDDYEICIYDWYVE